MYRILIVGAGVVGQIYGHYMQRGGASVSFLVKEKYADKYEQGFNLFRCRRRGLGRAETYHADRIFTAYEQLAEEENFDQVWLAVSSSDLAEHWLKALRKVIGDTTLVMLQPDFNDRDFILRFFPESQLIYSMVNLIGYQNPLPDMQSFHPDFDKKGIAYIVLPMMAAEFSGNPERLPDVMEVLSNGRFAVKAQQNVPRLYADRSAWMIPLVALLELEGWSFKRLIYSADLGLAVDAAKQALAIVAAKFNRPLNITERGFGLFWVKVILPALRFLSPVDVEAFVKYHFLKTAPQTRLMLDSFIASGDTYGMNNKSLKILRERLPESVCSNSGGEHEVA